MLRSLSLLLSAAALLCGCATQYDIAGNSSIAEVDGHMLYLRVMGDGVERMSCSIDSCEVVHGRFSFGGEMDSVVMAQVYMGNELMMPIVLENGQLRVKLDPVGQTVEGGLLNKRLYNFLQKRDRLENQLWQAEQECIRALRSGKGNIVELHETLRRRAAKLNRQIEEAETRFVVDNYTNALGPGYYIMLCNQQIFPVMTEQLRHIADGAPDDFLNHPFINNYLRMAGYDFSLRPHRKPSKR
ncbi:MAG: DUF4369 domain-containing protein [Bacteroidaceae bacterium]|nr:DUF4369 domain-containing protein [Bacteroidaceae bacterium]